MPTISEMLDRFHRVVKEENLEVGLEQYHLFDDEDITIFCIQYTMTNIDHALEILDE